MVKINNLPRSIYLCGFMGTGKSTIGRKLAHDMDVTFLDLDREIERKSGLSVPEIFDKEGEEKFRLWERNILLKLIGNFKGVLSLGGGALQNQYIVDHIKLNGLLIFIETSFSVIFKRITSENVKNRPLLLDQEGNVKNKRELKKELASLYENRLNYYRQSEITINTDSHSTVDETVKVLVGKIKHHVAHN